MKTLKKGLSTTAKARAAWMMRSISISSPCAFSTFDVLSLINVSMEVCSLPPEDREEPAAETAKGETPSDSSTRERAVATSGSEPASTLAASVFRKGHTWQCIQCIQCMITDHQTLIGVANSKIRSTHLHIEQMVLIVRDVLAADALLAVETVPLVLAGRFELIANPLTATPARLLLCRFGSSVTRGCTEQHLSNTRGTEGRRQASRFKERGSRPWWQLYSGMFALRRRHCESWPLA